MSSENILLFSYNSATNIMKISKSEEFHLSDSLGSSSGSYDREGDKKHKIYATIFCAIIFTGHNEVVAKVIFLNLFVILFMGGCLPQCMLGCHPQGTDTPRADTPQEQIPPQRADTPPRADSPQEQTPLPPPGK